MKKRLRYKILKACMEFKGYTPEEKKKNLRILAKETRALRATYRYHLHFRKKGIKFTTVIKKDGYIDDDEL